MHRLSRELISALRLSFEAWSDVAARLAVCGISSPVGFEEGSPKRPAHGWSPVWVKSRPQAEDLLRCPPQMTAGLLLAPL
jgi:hypothetical protein